MADTDSIPGKSPAFQFYPNDFTTGTLTLTTEEVGAYILLLCHCWDKGSVPNNLRLLARIARISPARMDRAWMALMPKFQKVEGGYVQPRLEREREKQQLWREKSATGGRRSQAKRKHVATTVEPPLQPIGQPKADSSVFPLQSSSSDFSPDCKERSLTPTRGIGSGVMAGMLPRDHLRHAWCGRICVPNFLHGQFVSGLGTSNADMELRQFYAETMAEIQGPIGEDSLKFWRARVALRWPSPSASEGSRTSALRRASEEFLKS